MLAPEDLPATHARVMRVVDPSKKDTPKSASKSSKSTTSKPAAPASPTISKKAEDEKSSRFVEDFASSDESSGAGGVEDDGWNVVAAKPKSEFGYTRIHRLSTTVRCHVTRRCSIALRPNRCEITSLLQNRLRYPSRRVSRQPRHPQHYPYRQRFRRRTPKSRRRRKKRKRWRRQTANGVLRCTGGIWRGKPRMGATPIII